MKHIIKYILIFFITVSVLCFLLILATKIPKKMIVDNLKESAEYYENKLGIHEKEFGFKKEKLHYYADSILLNIMFYLDSDNAIKSIMKANYYKVTWNDTNIDFINAIKFEKQANNGYVRYWHGSLIMLKPLMLIFNIEQIYLLNIIIYWILFIILIVLLLKKYKLLALVFFITSIMVTLYATPYCLEYIWTVLIMLVVSIISILIEKKGNKKLYILYFVTGIITCFLDFLTTELLTILIPIIFVILIGYKENRLTNLKQSLKFVVVSSLLWLLGYTLMWFTKWILASIILDINAFEEVKSNAMLRINWNFKKDLNIIVYIQMLLKNIQEIYPLNKLSSDMKLITIGAGILEIIIILRLINKYVFKDNKKIKEKEWINIVLIIIAILPYVRFCFLANHSLKHSFFTYRAQLPSLMAIIFIIIYSFDNNIIKNNIIKKENKK